MKHILGLILLLIFQTSFAQSDEANNRKSSPKGIPQTIWYISFESSSIGALIRPTSMDTIKKLPGSLLKEINKFYPKIGLEFERLNGDTLYVKIQNSEVLTESMGTTGSDVYLAISTYTLTEIKNVNYVFFDMIDGSHAIKGVKSRADFRKIFEQK